MMMKSFNKTPAVHYTVLNVGEVSCVIPGSSSSCSLCWASPPPSLRHTSRLGRTFCLRERVYTKTSGPSVMRREYN